MVLGNIMGIKEEDGDSVLFMVGEEEVVKGNKFSMYMQKCEGVSNFSQLKLFWEQREFFLVFVVCEDFLRVIREN